MLILCIVLPPPLSRWRYTICCTVFFNDGRALLHCHTEGTLSAALSSSTMVALCITVKPHSDWSVVSEPYVCTVGSRNNHVCVLWDPATTICVYCGIPQQPCVYTVGSRNNHVCILWDPATTMCVYCGIPQQPCVCTVGSRNNHVCILWDPATTMFVYCGIPQQLCVCTVGSRNNHVCILWDPATTMCVYCGIPQQPCVCTMGSRNNYVCVLWDPATTMCVYCGIPQQLRVCTMGSRNNYTQSRQHAHGTQPLFFSGQASVREYWPGDEGSLGTFVRKRIRHPVFAEMNHTH